MNFLISILTTFLTTTMLIFLMILVSKKTKNWKEKWSPFECGFNSFNLTRLPFSMNFFLIAIIFIIFDVEISLIIPLISSSFFNNLIKWTVSFNLIMLMIILGTMMEWKENSLSWKK